MRTQLKVLKNDGSIEQYIHTKVIGTISSALSKVNRTNIYIAEQFADVVTYYLYQKDTHSISSSEIFSIITAILTETGYEDAAEALNEYHYWRKFKRLRTEVISIDIQDLDDAQLFAENEYPRNSNRWDKRRITDSLVYEYNFDISTSRMIASMVEHRIFNMETTVVPTSLIKQIVLSEMAVVIRAQRQLQTA